VTTMEDMKSMKFRKLARIDDDVLLNPPGECRLPVLPRFTLMISRLLPS